MQEAGLEPAIVGFPTVGPQPTGFANFPTLAYNTGGGTRTRTFLLLRQIPLPNWDTPAKQMGGEGIEPPFFTPKGPDLQSGAKAPIFAAHPKRKKDL